MCPPSYFISKNDEPEHEVSKEEFIEEERRAGFHPKLGLDPNEPATGGFGSTNYKTGESVDGRIVY